MPFQVSEQLCAKYSKEYGKLCRTNQIGTVNDKVQFGILFLKNSLQECIKYYITLLILQQF